jgi:hypothetical protein
MHPRRLILSAAPLLLLLAAGLFLWAASLFSPGRQVLVITDPYWDRLFWQEEQAAERLTVALLNARSRPVLVRLPGDANRSDLLKALDDTSPEVLVLSPLFSVHAEAAARRNPETRVVAWSASPAASAEPDPELQSDSAHGTQALPGNLTLIYPDMREAFLQAGREEGRIAASLASARDSADTILHLYHASGIAGSEELGFLRKGLRDAGWEGRIVDIPWPSAGGGERRSLSSLMDSGRVVFAGVYTGVKADEALQEAHRAGIPAAGAIGPEFRSAYPSMVRFTLQLDAYPQLRDVCVAAVRGQEPRRSIPASGVLRYH